MGDRLENHYSRMCAFYTGVLEITGEKWFSDEVVQLSSCVINRGQHPCLGLGLILKNLHSLVVSDSLLQNDDIPGEPVVWRWLRPLERELCTNPTLSV